MYKNNNVSESNKKKAIQMFKKYGCPFVLHFSPWNMHAFMLHVVPLRI